jgi:sec-independent protein translocase protein TatB
MFDIGFAELLIIGVVALLVIGPERLPEAVRTASAWVNRLRRGFNDIKQEVQQELHNDAVMRDLRETGDKLRAETDALRSDLTKPMEQLSATVKSVTSDSSKADTHTEIAATDPAQPDAGTANATETDQVKTDKEDQSRDG